MTLINKSLDGLISVASSYADGLEEEIFLVGGAVRDLLIGNVPTELDLLIHGNAFELARELADSADSKVIEVDSQYQRVYRVPLPGGGVDVIQLNQPLNDNLGLRDFTINSMAVPLGNIINKGLTSITIKEILDPLSGQQDLQGGVLRITNESAFSDDPIRVIRAARFIGQLGFEVEPATVRALAAINFKSDMVSSDRLSRELVLLFQSEHYLEALEFLASTGILAELFPYLKECMTQDQSSPHIFNVYDHQLEAARYLEQIIRDGFVLETSRSQVMARNLDLDNLLEKFIPSEYSLASLRMAVLLHDVGKASTANLVDGKWRFFDHPSVGANILKAHLIDCRFSGDFVQATTLLVENHMRLGQLIELGDQVSKRAIFRLHRDLEDSIGALALLYLSDTLATDIGNHSAESFVIKLTRLLAIVNWQPPDITQQLNSWMNGKIIMKQLDIGPGPEVGQIIESLELATVDGLIKSEEDARKFISDIWKKDM